MLDVREVTVAFGGRPVLQGVSLRVDDGEVVALLGPSGSGKSTLLRVIAGLLVADHGQVVLDGRDVTAVPTHRRGIGMVFQDEQLFPHRDVAANVEFGLRMPAGDQRPSATERAARVAELLNVVGLAGFERRHVTDLSGGEAKRVALARSLAPAPRVLLLDEPLTGLDRELHDRLAGELASILRATGTTSLLVTHDAAEAEAVADRVVQMAELAGLEIVELTAGETHPLRSVVLRTGTPTSEVVWKGDDEPTTIHLGVRAAGRLVAVSTWMPVADGQVQLRGMAVDPSQQGCGIGAALVAAGIERSLKAGATGVWANARDTALDFYRRHGFEVEGDGFVTRDTGLPHHRIRFVPLPPTGDTQDV
ncbi:ABC transporter ATP-binding protein [soil metagenome]